MVTKLCVNLGFNEDRKLGGSFLAMEKGPCFWL